MKLLCGHVRSKICSSVSNINHATIKLNKYYSLDYYKYCGCKIEDLIRRLVSNV